LKKVLHISTECYPAAKAGGMGDVVGALPLFLPEHGIEASVIIPKYKRQWFADQSFTKIFEGSIQLGLQMVHYSILALDDGALGYPFYCIDIPGLFDREDIYLGEDGHGYHDEDKRYISFQLATLDWLTHADVHFDLLHCHDHMTGLIPFIIKYCPDFEKLQHTPTVFTIHNGQYRGIFGWNINDYLPYYDDRHRGLLDWDGDINSLAAAIKCSWKVNTVSPSYMQELIQDMDTLTSLVQHEREKCTGIINGIDNELWNPATDAFLEHHLKKSWKSFKSKNKSALLKKYGLKSRRPLLGFIGRVAHQKGADILLDSIAQCLEAKIPVAAVILGSGDKELERSLTELAEKYPKDVEVIIAYNEKLAREIYAGCDFLMMPSRFEPCGLNQMYAMRYGTVPVVSNVGGLKDTVPDIRTKKGNGIVASSIDQEGFTQSIKRAVELYKNKKRLDALISKITKNDFSWNHSAREYADMYNQLTTTT